jgi:parallel beta-helix repeat protein
MKALSILLTIVALLVSGEVASAANDQATNVVVLTADQVHTAIDIENAFHQATAQGTRPGIVILDGSRGPFIYDPDYGKDFDLNFFYSNLTLMGQNNAIMMGGGGIYMDTTPMENITIKDLTMVCPVDCLGSWGGPHRNVILSGNRLIAANLGIQVVRTDSWVIQQNTVQAGLIAIQLIETSQIVLQNNRLAGETPIEMDKSTQCTLIGNSLLGKLYGISLTNLSADNQVVANTITGVQIAGINLDEGTQGNYVVANRVKCGQGIACQAVDAQGTAQEYNIIRGNRP